MAYFSIIIPAYNNSKELGLLLSSIKRHCIGINHHEVLVVDDGSMDRAIESVCKDFAFTSYLRSETNKGVANARNLGANIARNDILIFIDSDLIVQSDFISILSVKFSNHDVIAVSGTLSTVPANSSLFRDYWGLYKAFHMPKGQYTTIFTGQQGAIRKDIFWKAGGWNAQIRGVSNEEYEFTARLEKIGVKINYEPGFEFQPHFDGFLKLITKNYKRTKKWCIIFLYRKRFDDYTSTFSGGMSYILGGLVFISGAVAALSHKLISIFLLVLLIYLIMTTKFWFFIIRKRGLLFALLSIFFHLASSIFIFSGAIHGLSYYFSTEEMRRRAING